MKNTEYQFRMWWCGDYDCDCQQPQIIEVDILKKRVIKVVEIGTFTTRDNDYVGKELHDVEIKDLKCRYGIKD